MTTTRKVDEVDLFKKWQQTGNKVHFQALYDSMRPLIESAATKASFGSNLPKSAHQIYAAQNMLEALRTYQPDKGSSLQTHIFNAVHQKAKRLNYLYQNLGKIPEPRAMQIGLFQNEHENARLELGREPSAAEMAGRMNMSVTDVGRLQKELHKDLSQSGLEEMIVTETPKESEVLAYIYYELNGEQQVVYDYVFGKHGKTGLDKKTGKIDFDGIAKKVGFSVSKVRSVFGQIKQKYEQAGR